MVFRTWRAVSLCALVVLAILVQAGHAEEGKDGNKTPVVSTQAGPGSAATSAPAKIDTGDHAWMLVSTALVLLMTAPGLALFYCGLVRKKNVLSVMMQCLFLMGLMTIVWALWGYSLSFGGTDKWIGNGDYLFMQGVASSFDESTGTVTCPMFQTIPRATHMLFQGMFFIITPALICGAFAERMKFSTMTVFMVLWGTLVYCPLCHWVWGGGILAYGSPHAVFGALDFAGGAVVHISSGVSALVCAVVIGRRLGFGREPMPPHNLTYTTVGAALLWVGWFGFNAGSALGCGGLAASALMATHFAAAAGAVTWPSLEWITRGKPSILGTCSGAVAGLGCITAASGFVHPMPALGIGAMAATVCFFACTALKARLGYDDSLDVFGVHGVGGTLGVILTGVFATRAVADPAVTKGALLGILEGGSLLTAQVGAALVAWILAGGTTLVLLKFLDATMGLRVSRNEEIQGLDLSQQDEEGYIFI
ncbi:MAG: ammonium transporter [Pirellulales bacterium]